MGIEDRDWYREAIHQREIGLRPGGRQTAGSPAPTFRPPRSEPLWLATWAMLFLAVAGISAAVHDWHSNRVRASGAQSTLHTQHGSEREAEVAPLGAFPPDPAPVNLYRSNEPRVVMKCVVDGRVTYSEAPACGATGRGVPVAANQSVLEGGFSSYQLDMLRSADARIARQEAALRSGQVSQATTISTKNSECATLADSIRVLDARARNPISGFEQDIVRAERQSVTSRQFALRC